MATDELGMDAALLPEAEDASGEAGGAGGSTQRPAVERSAAVERQIALDALVAAQVSEELEGRHAGGVAEPADADAAQRRMKAGATMRRQLFIAHREERRVAGDGLCLYAALKMMLETECKADMGASFQST